MNYLYTLVKILRSIPLCFAFRCELPCGTSIETKSLLHVLTTFREEGAGKRVKSEQVMLLKRD